MGPGRWDITQGPHGLLPLRRDPLKGRSCGPTMYGTRATEPHLGLPQALSGPLGLGKGPERTDQALVICRAVARIKIPSDTRRLENNLS